MEYKDLIETKKTIEYVRTILLKSQNDQIPGEIQDVLFDAVMTINSTLYGSGSVILEDPNNLKSTLPKLLNLWSISINRRAGLSIDADFWELYERFKYVDREVIIKDTISLFDSYPDEYKQIFVELPKRYTFLDGKIDVNLHDYSLIPIYVDMLKENVEEFKWIYNRLDDYRSKQILLRIVKFWFTFNIYDLGDLHENIFHDYYDLDLLKCETNSVFVDCGAYTGDSIVDFINVYGTDYKRIYGYEISAITMESLKKNMNGFPNIELRHKGVGSSKGEMYIEFDNASSKLSSEGKERIEVTTLDDDIEEPVDIIKMDIEGAEIDALRGAKNHITQGKPKLLICTYHKPDDIFKIPRLIEEMRNDYKFYLRFNGRGIWPCDHVLFAV